LLTKIFPETTPGVVSHYGYLALRSMSEAEVQSIRGILVQSKNRNDVSVSASSDQDTVKKPPEDAAAGPGILSNPKFRAQEPAVVVSNTRSATLQTEAKIRMNQNRNFSYPSDSGTPKQRQFIPQRK
jgi:hypothetical protein